jgi:hypothetical protein
MTAALNDSPHSGPPDVMITDEDIRAAQERLKAHRPKALDLAGTLQDAKRKRPPVFTLRCPNGCTLLKAWGLSEDAFWWCPSVKRSADRAGQEGHSDERYTPEAAGFLEDTVRAAGGGWVAGLATCDHYQAGLYSPGLMERVTAAQQQGGRITYRLGADAEADVEWVEFIGRSPVVASPS